MCTKGAITPPVVLPKEDLGAIFHIVSNKRSSIISSGDLHGRKIKGEKYLSHLVIPKMKLDQSQHLSGVVSESFPFSILQVKGSRL